MKCTLCVQKLISYPIRGNCLYFIKYLVPTRSVQLKRAISEDTLNKYFERFRFYQNAKVQRQSDVWLALAKTTVFTLYINVILPCWEAVFKIIRMESVYGNRHFHSVIRTIQKIDILEMFPNWLCHVKNFHTITSDEYRFVRTIFRMAVRNFENETYVQFIIYLIRYSEKIR